MLMETGTNVSRIANSLHKLFVEVATACLQEDPADVELFCLQWIAKRRGVRLEKQVPKLNRGISVAEDDDTSEFVQDIQTARAATKGLQFLPKDPLALTYDSSNDEEEDIEEVHLIRSYHSAGDGNEINVVTEADAVIDDDRDAHIEPPHQECYLFSTSKISRESLDAKTEQYSEDDRMVRLFNFWDGDGSGAVDFVELVVALHKFEKVAEAGIDIQVASDALVQFVESDRDRELKLIEFTRVIILFALNNFEKDFDEVADHMLAVATGTSETAVLQAAAGADVSELEAADKVEEEFLRETARCLEEDVSRNIEKIRTTRGQFRSKIELMK